LSYYQENNLSLFNVSLSPANVEQLAKVMNMLVAIIAVVVFSWLSKHFIRQKLSLIFSLFFLLGFVGLSLSISGSNPVMIWVFYLYGDLFSTIMVATFFVFLNDSVTADGAKRLYGLVGLGGVLGGAFGTLTLKSFIKSGNISNAGWMWVCFGTTVIILVVSQLAGKYVNKEVIKKNEETSDTQSSPEPKASFKENPAITGARLVFSSKYLFSIVAIVGLYEIVSNLIDFQISSTILHFVKGEAIGEAFANAYFYMNVTAVFVQLFLTSFIMKKFGIRTALFILPLVLLAVSTGFLIAPVLALALIMPSADGGFAYSLNQSAKESLYVPTTRQEKYNAKAFIDMFVQRFAKVLAIGVSFAITIMFAEFSTIRWLSIGTVVVVLLWMVAANFSGKEFEKKAGSN